MLRFRRRTLAGILAVALAATGMIAFRSVPAVAAVCAPRSTKQVWGVLSGQDHMDINAQVSFAIKDRFDNTIDLNGCKTAGYSTTVWMNKNISGNGAPHGHGLTYRWSLSNLPANAVSTWIEVWTRTDTGKLCPTCDGALDTHRYGFVNRRAVRLNTWYVLVSGLHCGHPGGTSGTIQGQLFAGGKPAHFDAIYAWSELTPDGSMTLQGWGAAVQGLPGYYVIDNLAPGQTYVIWAIYHGKTMVRQHVRVAACQNVPLPFSA